MRWLSAVAVVCAVALAVATAHADAIDVQQRDGGGSGNGQAKRLLPVRILKRRNQKPIIVPKGSMKTVDAPAVDPVPKVPDVSVGAGLPAQPAPQVPPAPVIPPVVPAVPLIPAAATTAAPAVVPPAATPAVVNGAIVPPAAVPAAAAAAPAAAAAAPAAAKPSDMPTPSVTYSLAGSGSGAATVAASRHPSIQVVTFETTNMPVIVKGPNVVESGAQVSAERLNALSIPNPTLVKVLKSPYKKLPDGRPIIPPGTGPLKPKQREFELPKKMTESVVLKLGAKAGDNACVRQGGQCQATATCGGTVTRLLCPGPPSITCCTYTTPACGQVGGSCRDRDTCAGTIAPGPNTCGDGSGALVCCVTGLSGLIGPVVPAMFGGNCLQNFNGQAFADKARKFLKEYTEPSAESKMADAAAAALGWEPKVNRRDPASLVVSVLDGLGWGCRFNANTGRTVADVIGVIERSGKEPFHPFPKVGDVAMWRAHTGIVVQLCVGGQLELVTASPSFDAKSDAIIKTTGCMPLVALKAVNPDFLGFWTPQ